MKKRDIFPILVNALLTLLLTLSSLLCLCSGFHLGLDFRKFICTVLFWSLTGCFLWKLRWGWTGMLALLGLYTLYFHWADVFQSFITLGKFILEHYSTAYGLGLDLGPLDSYVNITPALCAMAVLSASLISLVLTVRLPASLCLPMVLLPLSLTLVVTDTVPGSDDIFLLLTALILLLMSSGARRTDARSGARLTALLLVPCILFSSLLLYRLPQDGYTPPNFDFSTILELFVRPGQLPGTDPGGTDPNNPGGIILSDQLDLGRIGPKNQSTKKVMTVTSTKEGVIYLRGKSYTHYTGSQWDSTQAPVYDSIYISDKYDSASLLGSYNTITVNMLQPCDTMFLPYYIGRELMLYHGTYPNDRNLSGYKFSTVSLHSAWKAWWHARHLGMLQEDLSQINRIYDDTDMAYCQIPAETAQRARTILNQLGINPNTPLFQAVDTISAYVTNSARYSLNTPAMPEGEDFALWFLESSDTGYCVHYASGATVLLQAAGIPARYVEGYVLYADHASTKISVDQSMAHAWVEYYVPDVGWVIMDPTPAEGTPQLPEPSTPVPSTGTSTPPATTEPSTAPSTAPSTTAPSAPSTAPATSSPAATQPPETTRPIETAGPSVREPVDLGWLKDVFLVLEIGTAAVLLLLGQWQLRLRLRYRRLQRGSTNQQALACWAYTRRLAKCLRQAPPEDLLELAQKAKFSQHTITPQELACFSAYFAESTRRVKEKNWLLRLWYRLVFAVY